MCFLHHRILYLFSTNTTLYHFTVHMTADNNVFFLARYHGTWCVTSDDDILLYGFGGVCNLRFTDVNTQSLGFSDTRYLQKE